MIMFNNSISFQNLMYFLKKFKMSDEYGSSIEESIDSDDLVIQDPLIHDSSINKDKRKDRNQNENQEQQNKINTKENIFVLTQNLKDFLDNPQKIHIESIKNTIRRIILCLKPYHYFNYISMSLRWILFLLTEYEAERGIIYCNVLFSSLYDLLNDIVKPATNIPGILNELCILGNYDRDSKTMPYLWRQQYAFENAVFDNDETLNKFIDQFFESLDLTQIWSQFLTFTDEIVKYLRSQYNIPDDLPQLEVYSSRALYSRYLTNNPLFYIHNVNDHYIDQITKLRKLNGSELMIREKFLPKDSLNISIYKHPKLYQRSVSECNLLSFAFLPDDLFYIISSVHEFLFEELVKIMYDKANLKTTLSDFRSSVQVGQEDIMPIIILILALSDVPNFPDIVDFFNEYSTHNQINTKTGLYMANIATAYGAIMNWEFEKVD
ncbi:hypothetical protein TRFO_23621 [Tritrichomonas foetus]|uniref:VPS9 domain-containing protein n=1 Tax=Tritrichomonas foetus TaxID=1144522 RepID=A0A1J4KEI7_9EUKA|nr:hypothetical protein TRFO_23621 [Tritrichomonas foetus]|eukprot:OHT08006.1 hypothetical protein TRFO_23621 [Tritrichomonas foetus]